MNDLVKYKTEIENMIYEIRGKQVMFDSEISRTKCRNYFYTIMIIHYGICKLISIFNKFMEVK